MNGAKIQLSSEEMLLLNNADWILTKNRVLLKAKDLLSILAEEQQSIIKSYSRLPEQAIRYAPKISRGENYQGMPWLMLDYPRCFEKNDTLAIRTFFWWGHHFSVTLQLAGIFKDEQLDTILRQWESLAQQGYYYSVGASPWEHGFEPTNFQPMLSVDPAAITGRLQQASFLKVARPLSFEAWDTLPQQLLSAFSELLNVLKETKN